MIQLLVLTYRLLVLSITLSHTLDQKCVFDLKTTYENSYDDPMRSYYRCAVNDAKLVNENETVATITSNNRKSNDDVTMFMYKEDNFVKFIPNSIFSLFPNLEYFWIDEDQHFKHLKADSLKNAHNLKVFHVTFNDITKLGAHVFSEAIMLEYINLSSNKIETIDKSAFVGLSKLKGVLIDENRIRVMYASTFSHLKNLFVLELRENVCINKLFENASMKFAIIEGNIRFSCVYTLTPAEMAEIEEAKEAECDMVRKLNETVLKLTGMIQGLERRIKKLEEKALYGEIDNKYQIYLIAVELLSHSFFTDP